MAQPYRAFSNAMQSAPLAPRVDARRALRGDASQFAPDGDDGSPSMDEMYRQSADWPNWPEDPSGQMPVMQNSRQAVQATKTMRGIDTAGRRDIVRQLMSERANQRAAMAAGGAGIAAAGAAGASGGSAMFAPATTLGKDDEVRPQREEMYPEPEDSFDYGGEALGPVGPRPRGPSRMLPRVLQEPPATEDPLASRDPFAPRYNDEELDEPLREEMYPEAEATEDPFAAYDSRIREEMYPEPEDSFGYGGEALGPVGPRPSGPSRMQPYLPNADKPLSQGGFPSGLLRHLLTPPPQDRPSY